FVVEEANKRGLYIGFLPTWGDKWNRAWGEGPEVFTPDNAEIYGEWLGKRYRDAGLIWILGGDRDVTTDDHREINRRMALGLHKGDGGVHLHTWHPMGGRGSAEYFHDAPWLDFNMRQNGHNAAFTGRYDQTKVDYDRTPTKPVVDAEPIYEGHPVDFDQKKQGHSIASDVRRPLYWDLFSGAFGHTYGHHSVWQMFTPSRRPVNDPILPWTEAIDAPGAEQMQYGRWLIESRPFLTRIPDQDILVPDHIRTLVPGSGRYHFAATRDEEGTYAFVYAPVGRSFTVKMSVIKGPSVRAWWYNPRNGEATEIGTFPSEEDREFTPPNPGEYLDWVLVLDDVAKGYGAPGRRGNG
ncbi:MAG: glycoside hydrolase family 140 protein, partial [Fimbriimonas sp.]